jgi:predicted nucleic acid-binding protein
MIGLDTNIILRYLLQDDPKQSRQANQIIDRQLSAQNPGFISLVTVLEIVWVLRNQEHPGSEIANAIHTSADPRLRGFLFSRQVCWQRKRRLGSNIRSGNLLSVQVSTQPESAFLFLKIDAFENSVFNICSLKLPHDETFVYDRSQCISWD